MNHKTILLLCSLLIFNLLPIEIHGQPTNKNFAVGAIGDSFPSGEGNPDVQSNKKRKVKWTCKCCHRSEKTFLHTALNKLKPLFSTQNLKLQLKDVSCTGSAIQYSNDESRIVPNYLEEKLEKWKIVDPCKKKCKAKRKKRPPQIYLLKEWMNAAPNRYDSLDVLVVWAGGNDIISFGNIIKKLFISKLCLIKRLPNNKKLKKKVEEKIEQLPKSLEKMAVAIKQELKPKNVIIFTYPSLLYNHRGSYCAESCPSGKAEDCKWLVEKVLSPVNQIIREVAKKKNWILIDLEREKNPGICSDDSFFIKSLGESKKRQGDIRGYGHPNEKFHKWLGEGLLYKEIDSLVRFR